MPKAPEVPPTQDIPEGYRRLEGSERRVRKGSRRLGPADPKEPVLVSIYVRRPPGSPPLPDQAHWVATPPGRREFLSREEFAQRYGALPDDLQVVVDFAQSHGLKVVETNAARRLVQLSGTVEQVSEAFAVRLDRYEWGEETYRGREGHIHLPNSVADVVEGVFGLDTRRMARRNYNGYGPPGAAGLTPPQVAQLYNFPTSGASGQTIGLLEFAGPDSSGKVGGGYKEKDIEKFFMGLSLTAPKVTAVGVDGANNSPTGDPSGPDGEITLDIDVAGSVAPGANLAVYFAPIGSEQDWADIVSTAVMDTTNKPSVLSCSWGWTELEADAPTGDPSYPWPFEWTAMLMNNMSSTLQEAATMGVTVFFSTGDSGTDCGQGDGQVHVQYPASDPWVTACGGTIITNVSGSSFTEGTWSDDTGVTGGGFSENPNSPVQPWQQGIDFPPSLNPGGQQGRAIPDVAGNASGYSGYTVVVDGSAQQMGGTSAVAPLYAGLVAILNASLRAWVLPAFGVYHGFPPLGYLNPTLYSLGTEPATAAAVFRDINDGVSNGWPPAGYVTLTKGYTSGPGWDACTGWGSLNGAALLAQLQANIVENLQWLHSHPLRWGPSAG